MIVIRSNYGKVIKNYKRHLRHSSGIFKFAKYVFNSICTLVTENSVYVLFNFLYKRKVRAITVSILVEIFQKILHLVSASPHTSLHPSIFEFFFKKE